MKKINKESIYAILISLTMVIAFSSITFMDTAKVNATTHIVIAGWQIMLYLCLLCVILSLQQYEKADVAIDGRRFKWLRLDKKLLLLCYKHKDLKEILEYKDYTVIKTLTGKVKNYTLDEIESCAKIEITYYYNIFSKKMVSTSVDVLKYVTHTRK